MALHLYDTYTRSQRELHAIEPGRIGLYGCGPTVDDYAHIGNLLLTSFVDLLRRALEFNGFEVPGHALLRFEKIPPKPE